MIKEERHIFWIWILVVAIIRLALIFPHRFVDEIRLINTWIQVFLFLMTIFAAIKSHGTQRNIYINFSIYFGFILLLFTGIFIGESLFPGSPYSGFYYYFYINCLGNGFFALFLIIFIVLDYGVRRIRTRIKYLLSASLTSLVLFLFFIPYISAPFELYKQPDYQIFRELHSVWATLGKTHDGTPRREEMTAEIQTTDRISGTARAAYLANTEYWNQNLNSNNIATMLWMPVRKILMYLNLLIVVTLVAFLVILYWFDRPYHPYIDKIIIFFIPFFTLEAYHNYSFTQPFSTENYRMLFTIGQYATVFIFITLVYVFHLALRFTVSPAGIYYEEAIRTSPTKVTRWRDEIDLYLLRTFIKRYGTQQKTISINNK
jgi:hypothetical protein